MDPRTWDRIRVEARRRIREREHRQEARVSAWERAEREKARPQGAPPPGYVAKLLGHYCPCCGARLFLQDILARTEQKCRYCNFVGVFEPREDE